MIKFWYNLAPNPMKIALMLEELGVAYEPVPVDTRKGEQHGAAFKALNPNAKVPVIDDAGTVIFDSNAILLWLADKHGRFVARDLASTERAETLAWLMFIASGVG
ncbi:MAG: glutathione S-transferase family protein, partial [Betaproteobacteria bacterium]